MPGSDEDAEIGQCLTKHLASPVSRLRYMGTLTTTARVAGADSIRSLLAHPEKNFAKIKAHHAKESSLKQVLTVLCSVVKACPHMCSPRAAVRWNAHHAAYLRIVEAQRKNNVVTSEEAAKLVDLDVIRRAASTLTHGDMQSSQDKVLLTIAGHVPAKRADLGEVRVVRSMAAVAEGENAIVVPAAGPLTFVFQTYKTASKYGKHVEEVPEGVGKEIRESLRLFPRAFLLAKANGASLNNNAYTQRLKTVTKRCIGVPIGVNTLRHIWVMSIDHKKQTIQEIEDIARKMMHRPDTQRQYFVVVRDP